MGKQVSDKASFVDVINDAQGDMSDIVGAIYKANDLSPSASAWKLYDEFMLNGGNSIANFFRSSGVDYDEVFLDVAKYLKIDRSTTNRDLIRNRMHERFREVVKKKTTQAEAVDELLNSRNQAIGIIAPLIGSGALLGELFIGLGLETSVIAALAGIGIATEGLGLLIPGLNVLVGAYAIKKIADPAYRKTVPSVLYTELLIYIINLGE